MPHSSPPDWAERFMMSLVPSARVTVLMVLALIFACGFLVGGTWTASREVDRTVRESERRTAETLAQLPSRPTLHQRLDAIEQRLQAIEQRLTP